MQTVKLISGVVLSVMLNAVQAEAPPCERLFREGVSHFERGDHVLAVDYLNEAIRLAPAPDAGEPAYLPYIYLAAAQFELGNHRSARDALVQSQIYAASSQVESGRELIDRYAARIMAAPLVDLAPASVPQANPVAISGSLNDEQAELIRARVLKRCALSADIEDNKLPWYFHYLLGLEYESAGDTPRALDAFTLGANIREVPGRNKRLYGMWYMDYLPYFQIARSRAQLGEWKSARDALDLSRESGEFQPTDPDFEAFNRLEMLVDNNLGAGDL